MQVVIITWRTQELVFNQVLTFCFMSIQQRNWHTALSHIPNTQHSILTACSYNMLLTGVPINTVKWSSFSCPAHREQQHRGEINKDSNQRTSWTECHLAAAWYLTLPVLIICEMLTEKIFVKAQFLAVWNPIFLADQWNWPSGFLLSGVESLHEVYCCQHCLQEIRKDTDASNFTFTSPTPSKCNFFTSLQCSEQTYYKNNSYLIVNCKVLPADSQFSHFLACKWLVQYTNALFSLINNTLGPCTCLLHW